MALATYVAIVLALYTYIVHTYIRIYVTKTVHTPGIATYVCNNCVEFAIHICILAVLLGLHTR